MLRQLGKLGVDSITATGRTVKVREVLGWMRFFFIHLSLSIFSIFKTNTPAGTVDLSFNMDHQFSYKNTYFPNMSQYT